MGAVGRHHIALPLNDRVVEESQTGPKRLAGRMQGTVRMALGVSSTLPARRWLIRSVGVAAERGADPDWILGWQKDGRQKNG